MDSVIHETMKAFREGRSFRRDAEYFNCITNTSVPQEIFLNVLLRNQKLAKRYSPLTKGIVLLFEIFVVLFTHWFSGELGKLEPLHN
jgi:hypothetical protein